MTSALTRWLLVAITVVGLGIDAYVHLDLAHTYDLNATTTLSQGDLFRLEAIIAIVVGVLLIVRTRWYTALLAVASAGGGAILVIVYRYEDIKAFGPIPSMYEPVWYDKKTLSLVAEIVAALSALALVVLTRRTTADHARPRPGTDLAASGSRAE
jgi:hypothetical protein